jgi:6-phosphogluconolactonase
VDVHPDAGAVAAAAAALFANEAAEAVRVHGRFGVALSGGSTPTALFRELASERWASRVDWATVHLFWSDERCVPPDHADSNYRLARRELLRHVPLPEGQIHRIRGEDDPARAAAANDRTLRDFVTGGADTTGGLDLILLGLGTDGHTASLFPGSEAVTSPRATEPEPWVVENYVPGLGAWRVTFTLAAINRAATVAFLVTGGAKSDVLRRVLSGADEAGPEPARGVRPSSGRLVWLVDEAAAEGLAGR